MPHQPQEEMPEVLLEVHPKLMAEWLDHPTTRKVLKFLEESKTSLQTQLSTGTTLSLKSCEQTALETANLVGQVMGQDHLLYTINEAKTYINQLEEEA